MISSNINEIIEKLKVNQLGFEGFLAWAFEVRPGGHVKDSDLKWNKLHGDIFKIDPSESLEKALPKMIDAYIKAMGPHGS